MRNNWPTKKLGDLREKVKLEKAPVGVVPYVEIGNVDVNSKKIIFTDKKAVKGSVFCPENSILISRVRPTRGAVVLIDKKYAVSSAFTLIKPKINPRLVFYFLAWNKKFFEHLENLQKGTSYPSVRESDILRFEVSFPEDENVQQKIVRVLDTVREAVDVQEKIIELTKELKKSLMAKLFREGNRGAKLKKTEIGEIPEDWDVKKLVHIATLQRGKDLPEYKQKAGDYPIIGSSGVMGYHNEYFCAGPGVITGRSGSIGGVTYTDKNYWPHNTGLYVKDFCNNHPKFIYYLFHKIDFKNYATGVSVPTLNRNFVHEKKLPLPSLPEQREIAEILQTVDQKIEIEKKKKELYEELFKTTLNKLMMREIEVDNLNLK